MLMMLLLLLIALVAAIDIARKAAGQLGIELCDAKEQRIVFSRESSNDCVDYLGSVIGPAKRAVECRLIKARGACMALHTRLWKRDDISVAKIFFFVSLISSVLFYGLESLAVSPSLAHSLDSFVFKFLKKRLGFPYAAHVFLLSSRIAYD
jgi:hypothetical protein